MGFSFSSVREWPNILATHVRFTILKKGNIRDQYIQLVDRALGLSKKKQSFGMNRVRFLIPSDQKEYVKSLLQKKELKHRYRMMICPGSKWKNKQIPKEILSSFLHQIQEKYDVSFLWIWGSPEEKAYCEQMKEPLSLCSVLVDRLDLSSLQYLMNEVDLIVAVDSSALHLCGTTSTPSFSIFGPTVPEIFKPPGSLHHAFWGTCPYNLSFDKTCPVLRSCSTGACIANIDPKKLFLDFDRWYQNIIE